MNIKVGMFFYVLTLFLAFFSRKIFLDCLGAEFIGLTGMLMNIMSFLSVAELGIGTSIIYFLYKPLQEDNHEKINEVMSMLAYLYRCIGLIIGAGGLLVSLLGKILSVFFIAMFWKPYYLFSKGLHQRVSVYWRGMLPYYLIFCMFLAITLLLRYYVIAPEVTSLVSLVGWGVATYPLLLLCYFLTLFILTRGMKYFIARKPKIYHLLTRAGR